MPYKTLAQLQSAFHNLVTTHPDFSSEEVVGKTFLNANIMAYEFGNPDTGGTVIWQGCIHGREVLNPEILLQYATWLFEGSEEAERILARNWTIIVPVFNTDNYLVTRKNAHNSPSPYVNGVDLNRNFVTGWSVGVVTACTQPDQYCWYGPSAASEPETQAMRSFFNAKKPKWFIDMHTGRAEIDTFTNDTLANQIKAAFLAQDSAGSTGITYNSLNFDSRGVGYECADAFTAGSHTMLWETHTTENVDTGGPAQETVATTWFPRFLPMAKLVSASVEGPGTRRQSMGLLPVVVFAGFIVGGLYLFRKRLNLKFF